MLVGFIYAVIVEASFCFCAYHQNVFGLFGYMLCECVYTVCWSIMLIVMRSNHLGRVIAGDLCGPREVCDSTNGYMPWTG